MILSSSYANVSCRKVIPTSTLRIMAPQLLYATRRGKEELALSLINGGKSLEVTDRKGQTVLHMAAEKGAVGIVVAALQRGADKDRMADNRKTPLQIAAEKGHVNVVRALMDAGASREGYMGDSVLYDVLYASLTRTRRLEVLRTMIEIDSHVVGGSSEDWKPCLHLVRFPAEVDLFVDSGANVEARDDEGCTPLNFVCSTAFSLWPTQNVVPALLRRGADVNAQDSNGNTPLHHCLRGDREDWRVDISVHHFRNAVWLLEAGADATVFNNDGLLAVNCFYQRLAEFSERFERMLTGESWSTILRILTLVSKDFRWRRRRYLVMCVARHRRGSAQIVAEATDDFARLAEWLLAGVAPGVFRTIVGYL